MAFLIGVGMLHAQENNSIVNEGEVLTLRAPAGSDYQHIDFPRKNIIIKRGAIANFKNLIGKELVVSEVNTKPDGSLETILKRKDGMNFFRFFPSVKANVEKALLSGELRTSGSKIKQNAIAYE